MTVTTFDGLGLADPLRHALNARGHTVPTPIQAQAIPVLLQGRDVLGIAQTGTGKTGAFALPILDRLARQPTTGGPRGPRALVLAPTRELAIQIGEEFRAYGRNMRLRQTVIFGGVGQRPQVDALARGVDIVIATPGRLLDLMQQKRARLDTVEVLVLDEADRMLDMGFIRDVRRIVATLPMKRQSLLFSATMPGEIAKLSASMLTDPVRVEVTPQATPIERIEQGVYHVDAGAKAALLVRVLQDPALARVIVFARTKHRANRVAEHLERSGVEADAIHGNKSQTARQRALARFRDGEARVLVATDIAARGIDVAGITHVINYELPNEPESYVHRIGRTARAGAGGAALSFCDPAERDHLRGIERLIRRRLTVVGDVPAPERRRTEEKAGSERSGQGRESAGTRAPALAANTPEKPARNRRRRRRGAFPGRRAA